MGDPGSLDDLRQERFDLPEFDRDEYEAGRAGAVSAVELADKLLARRPELG